MAAVPTAKEKEVMYALASQVAALAAEPAQEAKRREWLAHNAMKAAAPRVLVFPENSWSELVPSESLQTQDPFLRGVEAELRQALYHAANFRDDRLFEPCYRMRMAFDDHFDWGMGAKREDSGQMGGSYSMVPVLESEEDFARMKAQSHRWAFDDTETAQRQGLLEDIFRGVLPVRPYIPYYTASIIFQLVPLYGLAELMMDLVERPEFVEAIIAHMCGELEDTFLHLEETGRLTTNNMAQFLPSGSVGLTDELRAEGAGGPYQLRDLWGFADTQEFTGVSPAMWREFVLPYQKKLLAHFGRVYYGCCERMDQKWDDVLSIPNIRKVSVSPWSDIRVAAEKIGKKVIYCRKVNPSPVIHNFSKDGIRRELEELLGVAGDCRLEIVLKDLHTCGGHPKHVEQWVDLAQSLCK